MEKLGVCPQDTQLGRVQRSGPGHPVKATNRFQSRVKEGKP